MKDFFVVVHSSGLKQGLSLFKGEEVVICKKKMVKNEDKFQFFLNGERAWKRRHNLRNQKAN